MINEANSHSPSAGLFNLGVRSLSCLETLLSILVLTSLCRCQINDAHNLDCHPEIGSSSINDCTTGNVQHLILVRHSERPP